MVLAVVLLLSVTPVAAVHRSPSQPSLVEPAVAPSIGKLEGGNIWQRLGCVGCVAIIVGAAVELTPIAIMLSAASGGTMTAGCAFACTVAAIT